MAALQPPLSTCKPATAKPEFSQEASESAIVRRMTTRLTSPKRRRLLFLVVRALLLTGLALASFLYRPASAHPTLGNLPLEKLACSEAQDTAARAGLQGPSALVTFAVQDLSVEEKARLGRAVCAALRNTRDLAQEKGLVADWLMDLPVVVLASIKGSTFEASFNRTLLSTPRKSVSLTSGLVKDTSEEELLWVLGHEMGHGVYDDGFLRAVLRMIWVGALAVGLILGLAVVLMGLGGRDNQRFRNGSAGLAFVLLLLALPVTYFGATALGHRAEFRADAFGLEVSARAVGSMECARKTAVDLVESRELTEQDFFDVWWSSSAHPSTANRAQALRDFR